MKRTIHTKPEDILAANSDLNVSTLKEIVDATKSLKDIEVSLKGVSVVTIKGEKGEDGLDGRDGMPGEKGESGLPGLSIKGDRGAKGDKGLKGDRGEKGERGMDGQNGSSDTPEETRDKLKSLEGKNRLPASAIHGLPELKETVDTMNQSGYAGGGANQLKFLDDGVSISDYVTEINFSTNLTPTYAGNGRITLTASGSGGGGNWVANDLIGTGDATTFVFTLAATPIAGSVGIYVGGLKQTLTDDYSISGTTITFVVTADHPAPPNGQAIVATYMT